MANKTLSAKYYKGIVKTLVIYVLASLLCYLYNCKIGTYVFSLTDFLKQLLDFRAAQYAWYVEMYIGLFLIIPFINLSYNGLTTKKHKQILLLTLVVMTSLPGAFNIKGALLPDFWLNLYPVTYYFFGCYLREFGLKISKWLNSLLLVIATLSFGIVSYYLSYGTGFLWGMWQNWQSIFILLQTVLLFNLLKDVKFNREKKAGWCMSWLLAKISDLSFGAYLVSFIFDNYFYKKLSVAVPIVSDRFLYIFVLVPLVYVCSLLLSLIINTLYTFVAKLFVRT
jgi:surface polysaccharide O-acyltransferase-like enzyme